MLGMVVAWRGEACIAEVAESCCSRDSHFPRALGTSGTDQGYDAVTLALQG